MSIDKERIINIEKIKDDAMKNLMALVDKFDIWRKQIFFAHCVWICDEVYVESLFDNLEPNEKHYNEKSSKYFYEINRFAFPILIKVLYTKEFCNLPGFALCSIDDSEKALCFEFLHFCKIIGLMEYILENARCNNFEISCKGKFSKVELTKKYHWNEFHEQRYIKWYSNFLADKVEKNNVETYGKKTEILKKMEKMSFIWYEDFMGYTNDIEVEKYFYELARLDFIHLTEWEMFLESSHFGKIEYGCFVDTLIEMGGFAIKHIHFALQLLDKSTNLKIENLLVNIMEINGLIKLISENRGMDEEQANNILAGISLNENNLALFYKTPYIYPSLIKISHRQYIRSIFGLLNSPFEFLLANLKKDYKKDWDANANNREGEFKKQLYSLFNDNFICLKNNIIIKLHGKVVTDIDAVIIDIKTGEIGVFQLKWQDHTCDSIRSLMSKSKNFEETTSYWIECVKQWIKESSEESLANQFGLKRNVINKEKIRIFILGRRHGNFSTKEKSREDCVWAQWYQVLLIIWELKKNEGILSIGKLYNLIKETNPYKVDYKEATVLYKYKDYSIMLGSNGGHLEKEQL